ncbi:hypothetical protein XENTR_v10016343 [Xenopus tropicalis]|nr:hypothetical protein XENTR_v10016343 [Xenopus tropicalis]
MHRICQNMPDRKEWWTHAFFPCTDSKGKHRVIAHFPLKDICNITQGGNASSTQGRKSEPAISIYHILLL